MKKLINYYQERREELQKKLTEAKSEQKVEVVQDEIKYLTDWNGKYIGGLTKLQKRIATERLGELYLTFSLLSAVGRQATPEIRPVPVTSQTKSERDLSALFSAGLGGGMGGLLGGGLPGSLIGATSALFTAFGLSSLLGEQKKPVSHASPSKSHADDTESEKVEAILTFLEQRLEAIDRDIEAYTSKPKAPPKPKIEDHQDILEGLQRLIGQGFEDREKLPEYTRERIDEIQGILRHHGIEIEFYQSSADDGSKFDFLPSLKPDRKEYKTLTPAFVKGGEVLLRGSVIQPAVPVEQ